MVSNFGGRLPDYINNSTLTFGDFLLLTNTEIKFNTALVGVNFLASNSGFIRFGLVSFGNKCENYTSCSKYLDSNRSLSGLQNLTFWNYTVEQGLNPIIFDQAIRVSKGSMILVDLSSSNVRLLCDTSDNSMYSDYSINGSTLNKLYPTKNWKIHFNVLVENEFYETFHFLEHKYNMSNNYSLKVKIVDRNLTQIKFIHFKKGK